MQVVILSYPSVVLRQILQTFITETGTNNIMHNCSIFCQTRTWGIIRAHAVRVRVMVVGGSSFDRPSPPKCFFYGFPKQFFMVEMVTAIKGPWVAWVKYPALVWSVAIHSVSRVPPTIWGRYHSVLQTVWNCLEETCKLYLQSNKYKSTKYIKFKLKVWLATLASFQLLRRAGDQFGWYWYRRGGILGSKVSYQRRAGGLRPQRGPFGPPAREPLKHTHQ